MPSLIGSRPNQVPTNGDLGTMAYQDASLYQTRSELQGMRNRIINGDCRIDQRNAGASISNTGYAVDRFLGFRDGSTVALSFQQSTTAPAGFTNSLVVTTTTSGTAGSGEGVGFQQRVEGLNISDLGWGTANAKTVTLSFWVRSSLTGTFSGSLGNSAFNRSYPYTYTISSANTWEQKSITIAGDTTGTWLTTNGVGIRVYWDMGSGTSLKGTAGSWASSGYVGATGTTNLVGTSGATFYITGVQLEAGSVATPFENVDYGEMLRRCQRYYYKLEGAAQSPYGVCTGQSSTRAIAFINFPVPMRTAPTALEQSGTASHYYIRLAAVDVVCNAVPTIQDKCNVISAMANVYVASGLSTGYAAIAGSNNTSGYLGWSAEL